MEIDKILKKERLLSKDIDKIYNFLIKFFFYSVFIPELNTESLNRLIFTK